MENTKKMNNKVVVSYSGGMDSTTLLYQLRSEKKDVYAVNFNYGSKHNEIERSHAKAICAEIDVPYIEVELPFVGDLFRSNLLMSGGDIPTGCYDKDTMSQTVVPGRNGIFMSILAGYAESIEAESIAIANHAGDHHIYPDCRPEWIESIGRTISLGSDGKVKLSSPFCKISKSEICRIAKELGVPLKKTWSCYKGESVHCGICGTCLERKEAFNGAGIKDPTIYKYYGHLR